MARRLNSLERGPVRAIVVSTALLTFVSYWRAAAIVLCDLGSTAYYIGGIVEKAIGKAAPWFILAVMLFSYAVRALYIESCAMFVRGGVYRVVRESMGSSLARLSVSALLFDYILTGPISAVSAGKYLVGLANNLLQAIGFHTTLSPAWPAAGIALAVTAFFWWQNVKGVETSSDKALYIMLAATVMAVILIPWAIVSLLHAGPLRWPPLAPRFSRPSLGWLWPWHAAIRPLGLLGITIAFGHSVLAMSGEESLAQVYREIEAPKLQNLKRTGFIVFIYSLVLTSLVTLLAVMLIPDSVRPRFADNLLSGLVLNFQAPQAVRLALQVFVVAVGFFLLAGAVNTSLVGANGVLNRLDEDGVMPAFWREPHPRYGTSYRLLTLLAALQAAVIVISRGDVYFLGEAYAFGVVWSFVFKAVGMILLRLKDKRPRWRVPGNIRWGGHEWPLGLYAIALILAATALVNLATKKIATMSGLAFSVILFGLFTWSEHWNRSRGAEAARSGDQSVDEFNTHALKRLTPEAIGAHHRPILVPVRSPQHLEHLRKLLERPPDPERDVVAVALNVVLGEDDLQNHEGRPSAGERLITGVIRVAEEVGRPVIPVLVDTNHPDAALDKLAAQLEGAEIVATAGSPTSGRRERRGFRSGG